MKKRLLSILLTACLLIGLLPTVALAVNNVSYLDASGASQTCASATEVTSDDTEWTTGWYVVNSDVTIDNRITVSGTVHLILADGCTLTVNGGIQVQDDDGDITNGSANALTIYGQKQPVLDADGNVANNVGKLIARGVTNDYNAVIGGNEGNGYGGSGGAITINGGTVTVTSTVNGAAIGGGYGDTGGSGGKITINGGIVTATSNAGAGIGGGYGDDYGGSGGTVTINGGIVTATSIGGAGIGGGEGGGVSGGNGGTITITGGGVKAESELGAAIGGGYGDTGGSGGKIIITGGNIAASGDGTAIGGGCGTHGGSGGEVTITGGTVTATGNASGNPSVYIIGAEGIGGGRYDVTSGTDGTFQTQKENEPNGNAVIFASSIGDQSHKDSWSGVIFEGDADGIIYGESVAPTDDFTIPAGKNLTIPSGVTMTILEDVTLKIFPGATLTNNGALYVDGALSGTVGGDVYYPLTLTNCTGGENTSTVSGKTYGKVGQTVRLTATLSENQLVTSWQVPGETGIPTASSYVIPSMPAHRVFATARLANALTVGTQPTGGTIPYGQTITLSVTVSKHDKAEGTLAFKWYEGSTAIDDADSANYTTPDDLVVGDHTYHCVITCGTYTVASSTATVTVNPIAEATPVISIDYENESLTGFVSDRNYAINGTAVTTVDGKLSVVDYIGSNISIVTKASDSNHADSTAQALTIPARPAAPAAPTVKSKTSGSVTLEEIPDNANGAKAQYSMDGGTTWQDSPEFTGLSAGTEYGFAARYGATDNYFASPVSAELKVTTNAAPSGGGGVSTYAITVESTKNGTVTVAPKTASKGATVTLTAEPDKGYTLETLTVTDRSGDEIELTDKGDGKYTFKMPGSKVTVKATFMEDNTMLNFFVDVFPGDYYYDAVLWAAEKGITGGVDDTHFAPNGICTRAQAVTFLWRAAGSPAPKNSEMCFTDVKTGDYYYNAVLWAVENGITNGTGDTTFSPNATCSRGQIVTFLWRALGSPAVSGSAVFTDVKTGSYYETAVLWAVENGITNGTGMNVFSPNADCTRAQIVTFLYRNAT